VLLLQIYKGAQEIQTFTTMTADLLKLSDWLLTRDCTHVAMESTEYWKPVFNILEANFEVMLVMRNISKPYQDGRQMKDAQWIAQLLQHGCFSFIPTIAQNRST